MLIHNINGRVVDLNGVGIEVPTPISPTNPIGGSKVYPAATQSDLEYVFKNGFQDIVIFEPDEVITVQSKKKNKQSDINDGDL